MQNQWKSGHAIIVLLLFVLAVANAQPTIHGELSGSLGPGTYLVDGDCFVRRGESLSINPGTSFRHTGHFTWYVSGELIALGIENSPVVFTRQDTIEEHKWGGLRFDTSASSNSCFNWCNFDNCENPQYVNGGAIYLDGVGITFRRCTLSNNSADEGGGIYARYANRVVVDSCIFVYNSAWDDGGAIELYHCDSVSITNCYIGHNILTHH